MNFWTLWKCCSSVLPAFASIKDNLWKCKCKLFWDCGIYLKKIKYLFRSQLASRSKNFWLDRFHCLLFICFEEESGFCFALNFVQHGRLRPQLALNVRGAYPGCFQTQCWCFWRPDICFHGFICTIYLKKKEISRILLNMKAYVVVRGPVANIRSIVDEKGPEIIYFHCSNWFSSWW